jgi:hypothetical protein
MDINILPKVIHDEVLGIHSISELGTKPGGEALWLKFFKGKEVPILFF